MTPMAGQDRRRALFTFIIFLLGALFGGLIIPTMTHRGPVAQKDEIPPGMHTAATMSRLPVRGLPGIAPGSIQIAEDFNRHVSRICPNAGLPTYQEGDIVPQQDMLRCITAASLAAASPRLPIPQVQMTPEMDPAVRAYYRKLLEQHRFPTSGASEGRP